MDEEITDEGITDEEITAFQQWLVTFANIQSAEDDEESAAALKSLGCNVFSMNMQMRQASSLSPLTLI